MQLKCPIHGLVKFSYNKSKDKHYCTRCYSAQRKRERRANRKQKAIDYKGGECSECGYKKDNSALEFHHTDTSSKEFNISKNSLSRPWEEVQKELDKCVLLCANCHREEHSNINKMNNLIMLKNQVS